MMKQLVFLSLFLSPLQMTHANTLTFSVRSYPCSNGRAIGIYVANMTGIQTAEGYCDFETLRGYVNDPFGKKSPEVNAKNQAISEKCLDEPDQAWMKNCFDSFSAKCLETKEIRYGYSKAIKTYIKESCANGSNGNDGSRNPPMIPKQRGRPTSATP